MWTGWTHTDLSDPDRASERLLRRFPRNRTRRSKRGRTGWDRRTNGWFGRKYESTMRTGRRVIRIQDGEPASTELGVHGLRHAPQWTEPLLQRRVDDVEPVSTELGVHGLCNVLQWTGILSTMSW